MKKDFINVMWMLVTMLAVTACSDKLDNASGENGNPNGYVGDKGFVNIGINLPTTTSSRAENYDDGTPEEYKVNDVIIALFYGDTEENATCQCAFRLDAENFMPSGSTTDNITSYYASGVRMIPAPGGSDNVYALALVNPAGYFAITGTAGNGEITGDAVLSTGLKIGDGTAPFKGNLSDMNKAIDAAKIKDGTSGFLMTNAPIAVGGNNPSTSTSRILAPITVYPEKSYAEGAAKSNPVYVERAAAKVTVSVKKVNGNDENTLVVGNEYPYYAGAKVLFKGWYLQNTNKTFFPVRRVDGFNTWKTDSYKINDENRFVGKQANPYRILWAVDPNYTPEEGKEGDGLTSVGTVSDDSWTIMGNDGYCAENTTTAATMTEKALTCVLIKTIFTPKGENTGNNFFMINNTSAIYTETEFQDWAKNTLVNAGQTATGDLSIGSELQEGLTVTTVGNIKKLIRSSVSGELTDGQADALLNAAGGNIKFYMNGVTYYYAAVVKHFGDEAPYSDDRTNVKYDEAKHLGRFGVVRNTWYELTINKVSGPGEPEIPQIPTTPPDKASSYINCEINVLSWAKRLQNVEL